MATTNPAITSSTTDTASLFRGQKFDVLNILCATWFIAGIYTDGWAHVHIATLDTFFTPWHAVLYSGYGVTALSILAALVVNHQRGAPWRAALPAGYGTSLVGIVIFGIGGGLDLLWHLAFGIERSLDATLSPTHLILATGATLTLSGPLRAAWRHLPFAAGRKWGKIAMALLSLTYVYAVLVFFTQYVDPIVKSWADVPTIGNDLKALGVVGIILQSILMMGVVLLLVRRWRLPFGAFTLFLGLHYLGVSLLANHVSPLPIAMYGAFVGLIVDGVYAIAHPAADNPLQLRLFAAFVPACNTTLYLLILSATKGGLAWSVNLITGAIFLSGVAGLLISFLVAPAPIPTGLAESGD